MLRSIEVVVETRPSRRPASDTSGNDVCRRLPTDAGANSGVQKSDKRIQVPEAAATGGIAAKILSPCPPARYLINILHRAIATNIFAVPVQTRYFANTEWRNFWREEEKIAGDHRIRQERLC